MRRWQSPSCDHRYRCRYCTPSGDLPPSALTAPPPTSTPNVNLQQRTPQTVAMLTPALQEGGFSSCCSEPFVLNGLCPELLGLPNAPHDSPRVFGKSSEANCRNPIVIWCLHGRQHVTPLSPSPRTPARHRNGMATTFGPAPHFQSLTDLVEVQPPPLPAHDDRHPPPRLHLKEPSNGDVPCVLCAMDPGWQLQPHHLASTAHPLPKLRPDARNIWKNLADYATLRDAMRRYAS